MRFNLKLVFIMMTLDSRNEKYSGFARMMEFLQTSKLAELNIMRLDGKNGYDGALSIE